MTTYSALFTNFTPSQPETLKTFHRVEPNPWWLPLVWLRVKCIPT